MIIINNELEKSLIIAMIKSLLKDKMITEKRYSMMIKELNKK